MSKKYWVPAIERADIVLTTIAQTSEKVKLIDICKKSGINKSSLFSILNTLQKLGWVVKDLDNTYSLGPKLGYLGTKYIRQFDLTKAFDKEAEETVKVVKETIQLSILEGTEIIYLAKKEGPSRVRIVSEPGMRMPAHSTAMGKVMLSQFSKQKLFEKYKTDQLKKVTEKTVDNLDDLFDQIETIQKNKYIIESGEAVKGFTCIAAPIKNEFNEIIAAVSITLSSEVWDSKKDVCKKEILKLADKLSLNRTP